MPRRAANDAQRLEQPDRDLVGVAAGDHAIARSAVEALDRHHIGHAVAHEGVAHVVFQKQPPDAGPILEPGHRPADHSHRLVELVEQRRAGNLNVDRLGKADAELGHVLRARDEHRVVATGPRLEERRVVKSAEMVAGNGSGLTVSEADRDGGALAHERVGIERQQNRDRACRDIGEALAGSRG